MGFYGGDSCIRDYRREGMGFISHHEVEQRLVGNRVRAVIVCEFGVGDVIDPRSGVIAAEGPKVCFDFLVYLFSFSV